MLNSFCFTFDFHRFCQSGFYVDFFVKKFGEVFVRNILIYGAQFFGEKYMIEHLTKRFFETSIWYWNSKLEFNKLHFNMFFIQVVCAILYISGFVNILYLY